MIFKKNINWWILIIYKYLNIFIYIFIIIIFEKKIFFFNYLLYDKIFLFYSPEGPGIVLVSWLFDLEPSTSSEFSSNKANSKLTNP